MADAKSGEVTSIIPKTWPGAWGIYKHSKQAVMSNWTVLLALLATTMFVPSVFQYGIPRVGAYIANLVSFYLSIALTVALLGVVKGKKLDYMESFKSITLDLYVKYVVNTVFVGILLVLSFLALIVPFFFIMPRLILTTYFVVEKGAGPIEAIMMSWDATKGHVGKVYGIIGAAIVMMLPALTIIGIPLTLYFIFMYTAATVILYYFVQKHSNA